MGFKYETLLFGITSTVAIQLDISRKCLQLSAQRIHMLPGRGNRTKTMFTVNGETQIYSVLQESVLVTI